MKLLIEVKVGIVPGTPVPDLCRVWQVSGDEFDKAEQAETEVYGKAAARFGVLTRASAEALAYAAMMMRPDVSNWVALNWTWL